ncbi:MAG: alpha-amylase, partial [Rikenellaceae bacterium]
ITEGAKHVLGWKSPNFLYTNSLNPKLKLLLRNASLSSDINERFTDTTWSEWPLTADKFATWLSAIESNEEIVTLVIDYNQLAEHNHKKTGIFDFFWHLPEKLISHKFRIMTPTEIVNEYQPVAPLHVPYPISGLDEERDLTSWMGNELQTEAISELYKLKKEINELDYDILTRDFNCLQDSNYFLYMCTKMFTDNKVRETPYDTPYEAFINYMNILSDMETRIKKLKRYK